MNAECWMLVLQLYQYLIFSRSFIHIPGYCFHIVYHNSKYQKQTYFVCISIFASDSIQFGHSFYFHLDNWVDTANWIPVERTACSCLRMRVNTILFRKATKNWLQTTKYNNKKRKCEWRQNETRANEKYHTQNTESKHFTK